MPPLTIGVRIMRRLTTQGATFLIMFWTWMMTLAMVPDAVAQFAPIYRGGVCVADASGNCVGGDIRSESGLGPQVGFMKTTADPGTIPVYQSTCYSNTSGICTAWGLSLTANGAPVGYLSTTAPDIYSESNPLQQSNGLLLQNLGGAASAYLWSVIPPALTSLSPASGPIGTSVSITGTNFGENQGTSTVRFNGVSAAPSAWSQTSITAMVPSGATTGAVVVTVMGSTSNEMTFTVMAGSVATKLAVTSINGGSNFMAGTPFSVTVQAQDDSGVPRNVGTNTFVSLSLKMGTGILSGTLSGTIPAGNSQVTLSPITYTAAEAGVVLTAARTGGDNLASGDSTGFIVNPGAAAKLTFITQPANSMTGSTIAGPPTVAVQDSFNNTVTSSTASITIGIASNPGGGSLSGTTTRPASFGVAAFTGLSINQPGSGYTLSAIAAGLTSVTSNAFNMSSNSATIAGAVTRVSNGTAISGALVEVIQGSSVIASAVTNSSGNYSITGLSSGTYIIRASYVGFVPQLRAGVTVSTGGTTTVNLALNIGIAIHSPIAGSQITEHSILVVGMFDTSLGEVGINVNGYVVLQDGNEFAAVVPLEVTTTSLIATVTSLAGTTLASHTIAITVQPAAPEPVLNFRPSPLVAFVTEPVGFRLTSLNAIDQVKLDGNGDGTVDFTGTTLNGVSVTFAEPGLYYPSVIVTEPDKTVRNATTLVQVLDMVQLDSLLISKWNAMKNALRIGDTAGAADYLMKSKRATYQNVFNSLTVPFANIDNILGNITYEGQRGVNIEYEMLRQEGSDLVSYIVLFALDEDGVWRIKFF